MAPGGRPQLWGCSGWPPASILLGALAPDLRTISEARCEGQIVVQVVPTSASVGLLVCLSHEAHVEEEVLHSS